MGGTEFVFKGKSPASKPNVRTQWGRSLSSFVTVVEADLRGRASLLLEVMEKRLGSSAPRSSFTVASELLSAGQGGRLNLQAMVPESPLLCAGCQEWPRSMLLGMKSQVCVYFLSYVQLMAHSDQVL